MASAKSIYGNDAIHVALKAGAVMVTIQERFSEHRFVVEPPTTYLGRNDDIDGLLRATVRRAHTGIGVPAGFDCLTNEGFEIIQFYTPFVQLTYQDTALSQALRARFERAHWEWQCYSREEVRELLPRARELLKAWRKAVDQLRKYEHQVAVEKRLAKRQAATEEQLAKLAQHAKRVERAVLAIRSFLNHRKGSNPDIQRDRFAALRVARRLEDIGTQYSAAFADLNRPVYETRSEIDWGVGESYRGLRVAMSRGVGSARPHKRRYDYEDHQKLHDEACKKRALAEQAEAERRATAARQIPPALLDQIRALAPEARAELLEQIREMNKPTPAALAA